MIETVLIAALAAAPPALPPGTYLTERGWGQLELKPGGAFHLFAMGANGHQCDLEGQVKEGKATLEGLDGGQPCIVAFTATDKGVEVKDASADACSMYCGARASFPDLYERPAPGCLPPEVGKMRESFQVAYKARNFAGARAELEPVLKNCARWLDWITEPRVRNDLAVTYHRLGDDAACRAVLQPLAEDAARTDEELFENYPPSDYDNYLPVVKATRYNLKLCAGK